MGIQRPAGVVTMRLKTDVWHGYTRKAGTYVKHIVKAGALVTILDPHDAPDVALVTDHHGCRPVWVTDTEGNLLEVWECELSGQ